MAKTLKLIVLAVLIAFMSGCASLVEEVVVQTVERNFTGKYEDRFWKDKIKDNRLIKGNAQYLRQCTYDKTDQMWIGNWARDSFSSWSLESELELNAYRKLPLKRKEFAYGARFNQLDNHMTKITRYGVWPPKEDFFQIIKTCNSE
ncbi:MAG TPA: hypothetical protein EYH12_03710 [Psychromonas hadalis]|nr:hypothetical protein [Psychromonas hadalis]